MSDVLKAIFYIIIFALIARFLPFLLWILVPIFLLKLAWSLWIKYKRNKHIQEWEWTLLEIRPPRDMKKTPKVMEQFFAGLHGAHQSGLNWWDINMKGMTQKWFSFETVSLGGQIHFFIRVISELRDLIEAHLYAQYPEAEITQAVDYVDSAFSVFPSEYYKLWGSELIFIQDDAYPIRTYPEFERDSTLEDQRFDPISNLLEVMSKITSSEQIWIQTLIRPAFHDWKKKSEEIRDELINRVKEKKQGLIEKEAIAWKDAGKSVTHQIITGDILEGSSKDDKEDKRWKSFLDPPTKVEKDITTAIEEKASKHGFEAIIRIIYLAKKDVFKSANIQGIIGAYKLFGTQHLNGFKPYSDKITPTSIDYWWQFKKTRGFYRRKRVISDYKKRDFTQNSPLGAIRYLKNRLFFERLPILNWFFIRSKPIVLNTEELATIYHFPAEPVKTPLVPKVESRKSEPPIGLPVQ